MRGKKGNLNKSPVEVSKIEQTTDQSDKGNKQVKSERIRYENADEIYE